MKIKEKLSNFIVDARWYLFTFFILITIASIVLIPKVGINYDLTKYLPDDNKTRISLEIMQEEFGSIGNACVMLSDTNLSEVNELKAKIENVEHVSSVVFDATNQSYYKDNNALLKIFFDADNYNTTTAKAIEDIRTICNDYDVALGGDAVSATNNRNSMGSEMLIILLIAVVVILLILMFTSRSWLEPLVYFCVIGCAIIINMGTNLLLGEISFITQSISAIMLIALEMDYCIVLCSRYREEEAKGVQPIQAMKNALSGAFTAVIASSFTVMAGLVALMFMDMRIGFDIGAVLAKGVLISIFAVIFFMPSIILLFSKPMQKTMHKSFLPKMDKLGSFAKKTKVIIPAIFACLIVASVILQSGVNFTYAIQNAKEGSQFAVETAQIEETFGKQNTLVVIVPKNNIDEETRIYNEICAIKIQDETVINSQNAIVGTALYQKWTVDSIVDTYGIKRARVLDIFEDLSKQETDTVYTIELLNYLHNNLNIIDEVAQEKQQQVDGLYLAFSNLPSSSKIYNCYTMLTYSQAQDIFELSNINIMIGVYAQILGISPAEVQDKQLPCWAIMEALYAGNIENYQAKLQEAMTNVYAPFGKLTFAQVKATYNLPDEAIAQIFNAYSIPLDGQIRNLQIIQALNARTLGITIIDIICEQTKATIENGYSQSLIALQTFESNKYHRMIFNINLDEDDDRAIEFINILNTKLQSSQFDEYYVANGTSNIIEMQNLFKVDRVKTDLIIIIGILLIVLFAFRSLSIPVLLVLTIQGAIWLNLAIANIAGESIFFVCYLLGMAIQMGATIDYAILITDRYKRFRIKNDKKTSMQMALNTSLPTVLSSGLILILASFIIHFVSTAPTISDIGLLVGRGALISVVAVLFVLPQILILFDKIIEKTTLGTKFLKEKKNKK